MYRLHITVQAKTKIKGPGVFTKRLHAFILNAVKEGNPLLSEYLHNRKDRQLFSIYAHEFEIMIHSPNQSIIEYLQRYFLLHDDLELWNWKGKIQEVNTIYLSQESLMKWHSNRITIHFITPTTFYQYGNYYPLPEINRLLLSGVKAYQLTDENVLPDIDLESIARRIRIEHAEFFTRRVDFKKFKVIGFCGKLILSLSSLDQVESETVWELLVYGSLMGFGYKTAWGLGQTKLEPFNNLFQVR
ncbi:CRISPR system precrRNA processing endoribonuclease RAMP protein Cas6 [Hazenella sp. IB182353]|uniref:CRISPR system precrRNA processing endoribonuclease RAMP protein Cas6 n=1 Tax=Polycladospora coralii TaxID=2771432 RepID=UPI001745F146|nr:CRISPR system precrRNA processing endoribonuclease RAMP protein Cas6 [Polycladospora coralii]MBS7531174.1 CRISPR system precrRNA processing endoribonuclease RAMP protein Cas6 [Polycladospora coralii]